MYFSRAKRYKRMHPPKEGGTDPRPKQYNMVSDKELFKNLGATVEKVRIRK